jgi:hypothetical protein
MIRRFALDCDYSSGSHERRGHVRDYSLDYAHYSGRVVRKFVKPLGVTLDGHVIGRVTRIIDLGRPDPIPPSDPDEAIADDPWKDAEPPKPPKPQGKTMKLLAAIVEQLQERPLSTAELATVNNVSHDRIKELMRRYKDSFDALGRGVYGYVFGIKGQSYAPIYTPNMQRIMAYLNEHGPSTANQICDSLGIDPGTFSATNDRYSGVLTVVGYRTDSKSTKRARLWALRETLCEKT